MYIVGAHDSSLSSYSCQAFKMSDSQPHDPDTSDWTICQCTKYKIDPNDRYTVGKKAGQRREKCRSCRTDPTRLKKDEMPKYLKVTDDEKSENDSTILKKDHVSKYKKGCRP